VSCAIGSLAPGASGSKVLTVRFPSSDTYSVSATIFGGASDPNSSNDSRSVSSRVGLMETDLVESSFVSEILSEGSTPVQASLEINGSAAPAGPAGGPSRVRVAPQSGTNLVSLHAAARELEGTLWKIDFSGTEGFIAGSIHIDSGEAISMSPNAVIFRLAGSETRIRFRFRVEE
jgi:hypothetical protein